MTPQERAALQALARLVLTIEERTNTDSHEWFDKQAAEDRHTLEHFLKEPD